MTNADKFKTVDERATAFSVFCRGKKCSKCECVPNIPHCHFGWLELEAEEESAPLPCPFCGGGVIVGSASRPVYRDIKPYEVADMLRQAADMIERANNVITANSKRILALHKDAEVACATAAYILSGTCSVEEVSNV